MTEFQAGDRVHYKPSFDTHGVLREGDAVVVHVGDLADEILIKLDEEEEEILAEEGELTKI